MGRNRPGEEPAAVHFAWLTLRIALPAMALCCGGPLLLAAGGAALAAAAWVRGYGGLAPLAATGALAALWWARRRAADAASAGRMAQGWCALKADRRSRRWATVAEVLAAGALLAGCATSTASTPPSATTPTAPPGATAVPLQTAPAFQVRAVQGQIVAVPAGKPVVLLFGAASGCASCAGSEQQMAQVYPQFRLQAEFVTVDVTPGDTKAAVLSFAQQLDAPWPAVLAQGTNLLTLYHISALDTMYVLNARGQIVAHADTGLSSAQLRAALRRALGPAGASGTVSAR